MERRIGEIFEYNGEWYQCIRSSNCPKCDLKIIKDCRLKFPCESLQREDCEEVIFKKLEKVGQPYTTYVDKIVQNFLLETAVSVPPKVGFTLINNEQRLIAIEIKQTK